MRSERRKMRYLLNSMCTLIAGGLATLAAISAGAADIVSWNFSFSTSATFSTVPATSGLPANMGGSPVAIARNPSQTITAGTGASSATIYSSNWNTISNAWETSAVNTVGYEQLTITNGAYGSGTGPRDFKIQYKIGAGEWKDVPSAVNITLTDSMQGFGPYALPTECENVPVLYIRWLNYSTVSINGSTTSGSGTSRLSAISIKGEPMAPIGPVPPTVTVTPSATNVVVGQTVTANVAAKDSQNGYLPVTISTSIPSSNTRLQLVYLHGQQVLQGHILYTFRRKIPTRALSQPTH